MLRGIDPLLGPDLLALLRAMGHGDEVVIADANFPAAANAKRLVRVEGASSPRAARAILSVLPLDEAVPQAAFRMEITGDGEAIPPVGLELEAELLAVGYQRGVASLERHAFYARAREAYGIVATGELRFWGNLILKKGAIAPEGEG